MPSRHSKMREGQRRAGLSGGDVRGHWLRRGRESRPKSTPCKKTVCKELRNAGRVRSDDGVTCPAPVPAGRRCDSETITLPKSIPYSDLYITYVENSSNHRKEGENTMVTPLRAIRSCCLQCSGDSASEVKSCSIADCPLFGYRLGKTGRTRTLTTEQKQMLGKRLAKARESKQE